MMRFARASLVTCPTSLSLVRLRMAKVDAGFVREPGLKERHKGFVWGVYLRASHRGGGVGRRMMTLLLEQARKIEGLEQINISVATASCGEEAVSRAGLRSLRMRAARVEDQRTLHRRRTPVAAIGVT